MNDFSENQNALSENFGIVPDEEQLLRSDEKFGIWKSKTFSERQSIFKKVSTLSRYPEDLLFNWVSGADGYFLFHHWQ